VAREGEGGSGAEFAWKRERDERRKGGPSAAVDDRHRPVANWCGRARGAMLSRGGGVADLWARGHSNGRRGLNCFQKFQMV
jgi:hypothetical protein